MLKAEDIAQQLDEAAWWLKLPVETFVISAGAALVLLGLRKETGDIDVEVPKEIFNDLKARGLKSIRKGPIEIIPFGGLEIHKSDTGPADWTTVPGYALRILTPAKLAEQKRWLLEIPLRPPSKIAQDQQDLAALNVLLYKERLL